eukprot:34724_1
MFNTTFIETDFDQFSSTYFYSISTTDQPFDEYIIIVVVLFIAGIVLIGCILWCLLVFNVYARCLLCYFTTKIQKKKQERDQSIPLKIISSAYTQQELEEFDDDELNENTSYVKIKFDHETDIQAYYAYYAILCHRCPCFNCFDACNCFKIRRTIFQSRKAIITDTSFYYKEDYLAAKWETFTKRVPLMDIGEVVIKDPPIACDIICCVSADFLKTVQIISKNRLSNSPYIKSTPILLEIHNLTNYKNIQETLLSHLKIEKDSCTKNDECKTLFSRIMKSICFVLLIPCVSIPLMYVDVAQLDKSFNMWMDRILSPISFIHSFILFVCYIYQFQSSLHAQISRLPPMYPYITTGMHCFIIFTLFLNTMFSLHRSVTMVWNIGHGSCSINSVISHSMQWLSVFFNPFFHLTLDRIRNSKRGEANKEILKLMCFVFPNGIYGFSIMLSYFLDYAFNYHLLNFPFYFNEDGIYCRRIIGKIWKHQGLLLVLMWIYLTFADPPQKYVVGISETSNGFFNHRSFNTSYNMNKYEVLFFVHTTTYTFTYILLDHFPFIESIGIIIMSWTIFLLHANRKWIYKSICHCGHRFICIRRKY